MTTTDETTTTTTGRKPCPRCKAETLEKVPEVDSWHCDACGYTEGTAEPDEPTPAVKPTEVITSGEKDEQASSAAIEKRMDESRADFDHVVAMGLDDLPDGDRIRAIAIQARIISMSPLAPKFLRGNPWAAFDIGLTGALMGIPLAAAAELIDIIPDDRNDYSKGGRKSLSPELLNAMVERKGLGSIRALAKTEMRAVAVALEPGGALDPTCTRLGRHFIGSQRDFVDLGFTETMADEAPERALAIAPCRCTGIKGEYEFTWEEARRAGLAGPECLPGNHQEETKQGRNGSTYKACGCNQGYKTYPKRMMWWRASGFCVDDNFATAGLGLYSAEELGAFVDADGRMIDPSTVELPEGFEPAAAPAKDRATSEQIEDLRRRITDLPEAHRAQLKVRWDEKAHEGRLNKLDELWASQVAIATALVNGSEANARKDGWKPTPRAEDGGKPDTSVPEADTGAESPPDPENAPGGTDAQPPPESAVGNPGRPAPPDMAPDLAEQYGRERPFISGALVDGAIAIVTKMTAKALNGALRAREMATDGPEADRRANLARAMAKEQAEQDWKAANANPETGAPDAE